MSVSWRKKSKPNIEQWEASETNGKFLLCRLGKPDPDQGERTLNMMGDICTVQCCPSDVRPRHPECPEAAQPADVAGHVEERRRDHEIHARLLYWKAHGGQG